MTSASPGLVGDSVESSSECWESEILLLSEESTDEGDDDEQLPVVAPGRMTDFGSAERWWENREGLVFTAKRKTDQVN